METKKILLLDRDGTINVKAPDKGYIFSPGQFHFLPGVVDALSELSKDGFRFMVITNQAGVAKGLYSEDDVNATHQYMCNELAGRGIYIDDVIFCPHYNSDCECRKPEPGMFNALAQRHNLTLPELIYVGDDPRDMMAANRAGTQGLKLGSQDMSDDPEAEPTLGVVENWDAAIPVIKRWYQRPEKTAR